jgi:uncharacterized membrane protein YoaK (UPF0700 family)
MSMQRSKLAPLAGGILLIGFGLISLLDQIFHGFRLWTYLWPLVVIGFGVMFFVGMFAGGKATAWLAIPGSIVVTNGLMLFLQNLTGRWESWSYGWTVILMSIGLGIFIMGWWQGNENNRQAGLKVLKIGAILFIIFGAIAELAFGPRQMLFPVLLILGGIYLVLTRSGLLGRHKAAQPDDTQNSSLN